MLPLNILIFPISNYIKVLLQVYNSVDKHEEKQTTKTAKMVGVFLSISAVKTSRIITIKVMKQTKTLRVRYTSQTTNNFQQNANMKKCVVSTVNCGRTFE